MFRMRASSSLARKGSMCSAVLGYKCKELEFTDKLTCQGNHPASQHEMSLFWKLGGFLSTVFIYTVTYGNSYRALSTTIKSSIQSVAQKCRGKLHFRPVVRVYSDLLPGESWNKLKIPRKNRAASPSAACTPVYREPWTERRLQFPVPTSVNINCSSFRITLSLSKNNQLTLGLTIDTFPRFSMPSLLNVYSKLPTKSSAITRPILYR